MRAALAPAVSLPLVLLAFGCTEGKGGVEATGSKELHVDPPARIVFAEARVGGPQEQYALVTLRNDGAQVVTIESVWLTENDLHPEAYEYLRADIPMQIGPEKYLARVREIKALTNLPVLKAIKVANGADLDAASAFDGVADMLLFDAKAPKDLADALPGGNGLVFDWNLLTGRRWQRPWMLSGGLDAGNVAQAVSIAGAHAVDVSSGVEHRPGAKDPAAIKAFLDAVKAL